MTATSSRTRRAFACPLRLFAVLAIAAAILFDVSHARADESLVLFFAQEHGGPATPKLSPRYHRRPVAPGPSIGAPLELHPLADIARHYVGSGRFTRYARAWCRDALNVWAAAGRLLHRRRWPGACRCQDRQADRPPSCRRRRVAGPSRRRRDRRQRRSRDPCLGQLRQPGCRRDNVGRPISLRPSHARGEPMIRAAVLGGIPRSLAYLADPIVAGLIFIGLVAALAKGSS